MTIYSSIMETNNQYEHEHLLFRWKSAAERICRAEGEDVHVQSVDTSRFEAVL